MNNNLNNETIDIRNAFMQMINDGHISVGNALLMCVYSMTPEQVQEILDDWDNDRLPDNYVSLRNE